MKWNTSMAIALSLLQTLSANGQTSDNPHTFAVPTVRGVSAYTGNNEENFPIVVRDSLDADGKPIRYLNSLTIQFDVLAHEPPPLKIRFYHCDRNWKPDENLFVLDENRNTSFYLDYRTSPNGVQHYTYRYVNSFPDTNDAVRFDYSGNWIYRIMDAKETTLFAEGRFFVVDRLVPVSVIVTDDFITANPSPFNQTHKVEAHVKLPREIDGYYYTTVDIYQNRRFYDTFRVDAWDKNPYTSVEGYNTGRRVFNISNIHPGNEYRVLDISSFNRYPNRHLVRLLEGADQQRMFWRTGADRNGVAIMNRFTGINSDYLEVLFRLDLTDAEYQFVSARGRGIFLVGQFNDWRPGREDRLEYDAGELSYVNRKLLRRGVYDYQYVTGMYDEATGRVLHQDWIVLEGNDWRTSNSYTVFVYLNDPRFGGFDRIVGFGRGSNVVSLQSSH